jgi:hypothetical protein
MNEEKTNPGTDDEGKSALDSVEEALVGTHQEPVAEDEGDSETGRDAAPSVPGHRSP